MSSCSASYIQDSASCESHSPLLVRGPIFVWSEVRYRPVIGPNVTVVSFYNSDAVSAFKVIVHFLAEGVLITFHDFTSQLNECKHFL